MISISFKDIYCTELWDCVGSESVKKTDTTINFLFTRIHKNTQKLTASKFTQHKSQLITTKILM